jgi:enoyl-CoA hydratase
VAADEAGAGPDHADVLAEELGEGVRVLTLNRPKSLNALTLDSCAHLLDELDAADADDGCRVVVLTGAGRGFCSGWDLTGAYSVGLTGASAVAGMRMQRRTAALIHRMRTMTTPVIAAVNGPAAGGGFSLALACDIRLAAPSGSFHPVFIRLGISGGDLGASWLLPRAIGSSRAAELLLTGRDVDAEEAAGMGLISAVCADVIADAVDMARAIAARAPFAIGLTKEVLRAGLEIPSLYAAMELENRTQVLATTTDDHLEAVRAHAARRRPVFQNS